MVEKQQTGFKFGKYRLEVLKVYGEVKCDGRTYRLLEVRTNDNQIYKSLRLYNSKGRFIKQMLFEPSITRELGDLLRKADRN